MLKLFNSLTKKIEEFVPVNPPKVTFYGCGPTVYDHIHIGNCRSFIMYDVLHRVLTQRGYDVNFVQNITDVEDKIIKRAEESGSSVEELTQKFTQIFFDDINKLNILPANTYPKATEHISEMIKFIEQLMAKKLAYIEQKDSSIYFDVSEFKNYGQLSGIDPSRIKTGTRILSDEYDKEDVQDFALWKGAKLNDFGWNSPWGKGRPGWHIECSVMASQYLGKTIDIHAGGIDLIFPHHENEIAQSEGVSGKLFVKYWIHGEFLLVDNTKMSKSKNNFYTLNDVTNKGFEPIAFRYLMLTAHYRDKLNFTWESLQSSQNALNNLREIVREWELNNQINQEYLDRFMEPLNNDLNTPQALAVLWDLVKSNDPTTNDQRLTTILKMDQVLGLGLDEFVGKKVLVPNEVMELVNQREVVRKSGDYAKSDQLRDEIKKLGFEIEDTPKGPKIK